MSNFTQAIKELTGFDDVKAENEAASSQSDQLFSHKVHKDSFKEGKPNFSSNLSDIKSTTRITSSMVVKGDIETNGSVQILGSVLGNISSQSDISVMNYVNGDIKGNKAFFYSAKIKGNVTLSENMAADKDTVIVGDVVAENVTVAGKIKGNLEVANSAILKENALIYGDITVGTLSTEQGAKIIGNIKTRDSENEFDIDSLFEIGGEL